MLQADDLKPQRVILHCRSVPSRSAAQVKLLCKAFSLPCR